MHSGNPRAALEYYGGSKISPSASQNTVLLMNMHDVIIIIRGRTVMSYLRTMFVGVSIYNQLGGKRGKIESINLSMYTIYLLHL